MRTGFAMVIAILLALSIFLNKTSENHEKLNPEMADSHSISDSEPKTGKSPVNFLQEKPIHKISPKKLNTQVKSDLNFDHLPFEEKIALVNNLHKQGRTSSQEVKDIMESLLKENPRDPEVAKLALIPLEGGSIQELRDHLEKYIDIAKETNPGDPDVLSADMYFAILNKEDNLIEKFNVFIDAYPNDHRGHYYKAGIQAAIGDTEGAMESLMNAQSANSDSIEVNTAKDTVEQKEGNFILYSINNTGITCPRSQLNYCLDL